MPNPDLPDSERAALLRSVLDTAAAVVVGLRPDHSIFLWNRSAEQLYQTPRADALGRDYVDTFIVPEHRAAVAQDIREVLEGKETFNFEDDSILPDGTRRTLVWNVSRFVDADGVATGIVAVGHDITERKTAEERFRLVFEHASEGLLLSERGYVIDCNPAALAMLGLTDKAQLVGRRPAEFSPPRQPDGSLSDEKSRALGALTRVEGRLAFEWTHRGADGRDVPVEVRVRHATLAGRLVSVVAWHDLTAQRAYEEAQAQMQQRLAEVQKQEAIGQLAGGVAHDFNNLLTAMRTAIDLAAASVPAGSPAHEDLDLAREVAQRAGALSRQLMLLGRQAPDASAAVDLGQVVHELYPLLRTSTGPAARVQLDLADQPCVVASDRTPLEQVVLNLVLNARDAMPSGGTVRVRVAPDGGRGVARLVVADDGIGMDEATRSRIFEPFFTTKAPGQGTGLGLAVVQGVVIELGGTVHVESLPGQGSTFTVELPLATVDVTPPSGDGVEPARRNGCVLLVDDEPLVRSTTRRMLERAGWQVLEAGDGEEGWRVWQAQQATIQVVLTDVRMPVLDGVRMAARIAEASPALPIVFVSGWEGHDGATRVPPEATLVQKPFDAGRLLDVLTRATRTPSLAG